MRKIFLTSFILFSAGGSLFAGTCSSPSATVFLQQGETSYKNRLDDKEARNALDYFVKASSEDPTCAEAFAGGSKAAWWVGDSSVVKKEKMELFQKGINLAKQALQLNPQSAAAHFWLAGNDGSYGETRGVLKSLFLVKPIRHELNEVLKIDPNFEGGAAYRVLGVVDYKVPGFAGGNRKRALEQLQKAASIAPDNCITLYYLAEYFEVVGDKQKSREQLDRLDALKPTEETLPDWTKMEAKGKKLREKLK